MVSAETKIWSGAVEKQNTTTDHFFVVEKKFIAQLIY